MNSPWSMVPLCRMVKGGLRGREDEGNAGSIESSLLK
jgi:hypothetical protein